MINQLSYEEVLQIVKLFEASTEFSELHLKYGEADINLRRHGASPSTPETPSGLLTQAPAVVPSVTSMATGATTVQPALARTIPPDACVVKSPTVGTFYMAPEPGAPPFVAVGQRVTPETTVCIIEVMKLLHSVPAGYAGIVTQVLVKDAEPVEFGQPLIIIDPEGSSPLRS